MTRIKICGITNQKDLETVTDAGADAVGFVTDVPVETPRNLSPDEAEELTENVPPFVSSTLVIMPEDYEHAVELVEKTNPDVVQVHSGLDIDELKYLKKNTQKKVIRKIDLDTDTDEYEGIADAFLVDSSGEKGRGGTGELHDWGRARKLAKNSSLPVILAGGLTPTNVSDAIQTVDPYGVDVSSGVEEEGGKKSRDLVEEFIRNSRKEVVNSV